MSQEVLQEFLVKLGYVTDKISLKKFEDGLSESGKKVVKTGVAVAGVVAAVEGATIAFAYSMRRMYFDSQISNTTAANLRNISYAAKQVGIDSDAMAETAKQVGMNMRLDPGLQGMANMLGLDPKDGTKLMADFAKNVKARGIPIFAAGQLAESFGIDREKFLHMWDNPEGIKKGMSEADQKNKELGFDPNEAAKNGKDLADSFDKLALSLKTLEAAFLRWTQKFNLDILSDTSTFSDNLIKALSDKPDISKEGKKAILEGATSIKGADTIAIAAPVALAVLGGAIGFFTPIPGGMAAGATTGLSIGARIGAGAELEAHAKKYLGENYPALSGSPALGTNSTTTNSTEGATITQTNIINAPSGDAKAIGKEVKSSWSEAARLFNNRGG